MDTGFEIAAYNRTDVERILRQARVERSRYVAAGAARLVARIRGAIAHLPGVGPALAMQGYQSVDARG